MRLFFENALIALNSNFWQGLSEEALNAFRVLRADGLKPSLLALNSLINAFGEDRRDAEAFAVLRYMKENVCYHLTTYHFVYHKVQLFWPSYYMSIGFSIIVGLETRCDYVYYTYESSDSCW